MAARYAKRQPPDGRPEAVGVRAIQIARPELNGQVPRSAFPLVRSLLDVPALL